jgi:hypothetical protein
LTSSYENNEPIFEDFFRIKSAGSSNYRGTCFSVGGLRQKEAIYLRAYKAPYGKLPIMSIENPTLAHFRHFSHFRHSVPRSFPTNCTILKGVRIITYFQTHSFLTNKANFGKAQMNINIYYIKDYQTFIPLAGQKNKPNSNPIKANLQKAKMTVNLYFIEDYRKKDDFSVRINKPNFRKAKMNVNLTLTKDYRKKDDFSVRINKPNFRNGQNERKLNFHKGLQKKRLFRSPKNKPKQTQFQKSQNEPKRLLSVDSMNYTTRIYYMNSCKTISDLIEYGAKGRYYASMYI